MAGDDPTATVVERPESADRIAADLAAVDQALARIESGRYGTCTECGEPLDDAALEADPTVLVCAAHLRLEPAVTGVVADHAIQPAGDRWS